MEIPVWLLDLARHDGPAAVAIALILACVTIYRIRVSRGSKPAPHLPAHDVAPLSATRRRLLIVDDDPSACAALRRVLEEEFPAVEVLVAGDVPEAAEMLHGQAPPDVAIIDCYLPSGNGWDLAGTVPRKTRVILISGAVDDRLLPQLADDAAAIAMRKPLELDDLIRTVRLLLAAPSRASAPAIRE